MRKGGKYQACSHTGNRHPVRAPILHQVSIEQDTKQCQSKPEVVLLCHTGKATGLRDFIRSR